MRAPALGYPGSDMLPVPENGQEAHRLFVYFGEQFPLCMEGIRRIDEVWNL